MRRLGASRRELFDRLEASTLLDLPPEPFEYAEWRRCRVGLDYHVEVLGHWYSVPHRLARAVVDA
ncbi:MAG TPA: IS21 family transposase, partial [Falsiroseomonas sp.]|nr:IS21 family transposase [Falsiroseomonas sp.]